MPKFFNLSAAARHIGISRPTLYTYLDRFPPMNLAGWPVLTDVQVRQIKAERRKRKNGKLKQQQSLAA